MTMLITIPVYARDKNDSIEYYESVGMRLDSTHRIDRDTINLVFSCDKDTGAAIMQAYPEAQGHLSFQDGTSSPLYIRRTSFDD